MRQQDAEEFLGHLLTVLRRYNHQARGGAPGKRSSVLAMHCQPISASQERESQRKSFRLDWNSAWSVWDVIG